MSEKKTKKKKHKFFFKPEKTPPSTAEGRHRHIHASLHSYVRDGL